MSLTTVTERVTHVRLRLRSLLDNNQAASVPTDGDSFGCGMCFPYQCNCNAHTGTTLDRPPSPHKSFLQPINRSTQQSQRVNLSGRTGKQTNVIEEKLRRLSAAAAVPPCTRCHAPMPAAAHTTITTNAMNTCKSCRIITAEELSKHSTQSDLWVSLNGGAYNLTAYASVHPGGTLPLLDVAGCDATDVFRVFHTAEVQSKLPVFQVGLMGEFDQHGHYIDGAWSETPLQKDFHDMVRQIESEGLFQTDFAWYWMKAAVLAAMFASAAGLMILGGHWTAHVVAAIVLGMFWQQLAFLGHDLGHNSVRGTADKDWFCGLIVTGFFGVSVQWWKRSHNVHHVVTNSIEHDPDIQYLPVFSVSEKLFSGYYSSYHQKAFSFDAIGRLLVAYQHYLYYPIMSVARVNLYLQSILLLADTSKVVRHRVWECAAIGFFYVWYACLSACLPDWQTRVWFFFLSHGVAGLVHVQITLSHFSMPVYGGRGYSPLNTSEGREHFLRTQFATAMDIECPTWLDWLHGGLQFQVTHHLIPRIPRHNLRYVRETFVKPFARAHGLVYNEEDFLQANTTVFQSLKTAAMASRQLPRPFTQSFLWQAIQAEG